jgi:glycosyltransferase involved in cell wall biosynthesis
MHKNLKYKSTIVYFIDDVHSSFVIKDIEELSKRFKQVLLFSIDSIKPEVKFQSNVVVYQRYLNWNNFRPLKILLGNILRISFIYLKECIAKKEILPLKKSIALLASNFYKTKIINEILIKNQHDLSNSIFYSFWFYDCIFLAILRFQGVSSKAYSRAHGGDLFEDRISLKDKVLFRYFQLKHLDAIFSISKMGMDYLKLKYPDYNEKINCYYLGSDSSVFDHIKAIGKDLQDKSISILSCGNIVNGKRIYLIPDLLQNCAIDIHWTHFGKVYEDETYDLFLKGVEKLKDKSNIKVSIRGDVEHQEILNFYTENYVHLFLSLSYAEGIPVTMMEATSFGVPILATNVGGCCEIVNERTGILVDRDIDMNTLSDSINQFPSSHLNNLEFRNGVREFWKENFSIDKNYSVFCEAMSTSNFN